MLIRYLYFVVFLQGSLGKNIFGIPDFEMTERNCHIWAMNSRVHIFNQNGTVQWMSLSRYPNYKSFMGFIKDRCCRHRQHVVQIETDCEEQLEFIECGSTTAGNIVIMNFGLLASLKLFVSSERVGSYSGSHFVDTNMNCVNEFGRMQPSSLFTGLCRVSVLMQMEEDHSNSVEVYVGTHPPHVDLPNMCRGADPTNPTNHSTRYGLLAVTRGFALVTCHYNFNVMHSIDTLMHHLDALQGSMLSTDLHQMFAKAPRPQVLSAWFNNSVQLTSPNDLSNNAIYSICVLVPGSGTMRLFTYLVDACNDDTDDPIMMHVCGVARACKTKQKNLSCRHYSNVCFQDFSARSVRRTLMSNVEKDTETFRVPIFACCKHNLSDSRVWANTVYGFFEPWLTVMDYLWSYANNSTDVNLCGLGILDKKSTTCTVYLDRQKIPLAFGYISRPSFLRQMHTVKVLGSVLVNDEFSELTQLVTKIFIDKTPCYDAGHFHFLQQMQLDVTVYKYSCVPRYSEYGATCDHELYPVFASIIPDKYLCATNNNSRETAAEEYCYKGYRLMRTQINNTMWERDMDDYGEHMGSMFRMVFRPETTFVANEFLENDPDGWLACGTQELSGLSAFWFCVCRARTDVSCNEADLPRSIAHFRQPVQVPGASCPQHKHCLSTRMNLKGIQEDQHNPLCWLLSRSGTATPDEGGCMRKTVTSLQIPKTKNKTERYVERAPAICAQFELTDGPVCFVVEPMDTNPNVVCCCQSGQQPPDQCAQAERHVYLLKKEFKLTSEFLNK